MIATQLKHRKKSIDLTEGAILPKMIRFVLPLMATNFLQTFYSAADMMIVSLSSESNAVGAIGATGSLTNLIINIFMGFAVGTNVLVARYLGAKDSKRVSKIVHTSVIMSLIFGVFTAILGLFLSRPILHMMGADDQILDLATLYTKIYFCGNPFLAATNYLASVFRAKGDTKTPLYVLSVAGMINVALNLLFVLVFGMSVDGVATATAISNLLSAAALLYILMKDDSPCRFEFSKCKLDGRAFVSIVKEGLPAGIQGSIFSFSTVMIQSSIFKVNNLLVPAGSEYAPVVNGTSAMANLDGFINTAVNSVYQASITFTSQNYGARKYKRIRKVIITSLLFGTVVGLLGSLIITLFRDPLLALYGIKKGAEGSLELLAYNAAMTRCSIVTATYFLLGLMNISTGVMRGLGKTLTSTVISLVGACLLRVLWIVFVVDMFLSLEMIYVIFPITWLLTGLAQLFCAIAVLKRKIREDG